MEKEIEIPGNASVEIVFNNNLKMSKGKLAAQAVHAALNAYGIPHGRVVVLGGSKTKVLTMPHQVRDAGVTELKPGTLTCGAQLVLKGAKDVEEADVDVETPEEAGDG